MYKLFINNIQIGNYKNYKEMFNSLVNCLNGNTTKSIHWNGNECFIELY